MTNTIFNSQTEFEQSRNVRILYLLTGHQKHIFLTTKICNHDTLCPNIKLHVITY